MGTSVAGVEVRFRATGVAAVQSGLRLVKSEAAGVNMATAGVASGFKSASKEAEGFSHSASFGLGELARGLSSVASSGTANAMGMREIAGGASRLTMALGPGAGLIGVFLTLGGVITEVFMKARKEIQATQEKFTEEIAKMANAGRGGDLQTKYRELLYGTPYDDKGQLRGPGSAGSPPGTFGGSLLDLRSKMAYMRSQLLPSGYLANDIANQPIFTAMRKLQPQLDAMEAQARQIQTAIDVMASQPATMSGMLPMKITAARPETAAQIAKAADAAINKAGLVFDIHKALAAQDFQRDVVSKAGGVQTSENYAAGSGPSRITLVGKGPQIAKIPPSVADGIVKDFAENVQIPTGKLLQDGMANTIGSSISAGITAGFQRHSIGAGLAAGGKAILSGIGGMIEQEGELWIKYGVIKSALSAGLTNPFTSGPAMIAGGAALVALGAAVSSLWSGGSSGGSSGAYNAPSALVTSGFINGAPSTTPPSGSTVTPRQPVTNNITMLGNDPVAARQLQEILDRNAKLSAA